MSLGITALINPLRFPYTWDTFQVAGQFSPGVIPPGGITGFERKFEFDRKKGKGAFGETLTFTQKPSAEGKIKLHLWTAAQIDALITFVPILQYDPTKLAVVAVDLYHPSLAVCGVGSVVTEYISPLRHVGKGLYEIEFSFIEFNPPPKLSAVSSPSRSATQGASGAGAAGVAAGAPAGSVRDPVGDANDREIARLTLEAQKP